jgi:TusA-related sulfurtransferase
MQSRSREPPEPQAVLEAGEEESAVLMAAIERQLDVMAPNEVLQVVSRARTAPLDVVVWCHVTRHQLIELRAGAGITRFWIRKQNGGWDTSRI